MSTLPEFLSALVIAFWISAIGYHWWLGQYGGNFNPDASLDTSQVIDATGDPHGLFMV